MKRLVVALFLMVSSLAFGQSTIEKKDVFGTSACMGCHGMNAMGGLGPPLAQTKLSESDFVRIARDGKGMMPPTPVNVMSDEELRSVYEEVKAKAWKPDEIPISYKVGALLTTRNVSFIFLGVFLFATIFAIRGLVYWIRLAGFKYMKPALRKFGVLKAWRIGLQSLIVDGFFVRSLWLKNKHRWFMHGLMLYGMFGLMLADILLQIFNPTRAHLAFSNPLKILPLTAGLMVLVGVMYVMKRYRTDEYIDNGLTLGKDYLFVTLLFHTVLSGMLTLAINRTTAHGWVMPIYLYHLVCITALIVSAPFTRFQHAWVVPVMIALTRVTEAVTASGVELGFLREPSPGRHHKSLRIAEDVMLHVDPELASSVKLRYYP
ncbi:MAG: c-type cytochrome [Fimbriimonadaceae bacterium]|nr:c-type cytochrome [Fimbriimonadaceae bacterium]